MNINSRILSFMILICMIFSNNMYGKGGLVPESLVLTSTDNLRIVYSHKLQKNQTIFGLAKFFNTKIDAIAVANPGVQLNNIKLNQQIQIPINTDMISSERNLSPSKHYIPVFYTVKAKDNLFRIAKIYFNQKIENVMNINDLKTMDLSPGQKLLVGWYEYDDAYKTKIAWTDKGIEVNTAERRSRVDIEINKPYVPVQVKRKNVSDNPDKERMVFKKVVSKRETPLPQDNEVIIRQEVKQENTSTKQETPVEVVTETTETVVAEDQPDVDETNDAEDLEEVLELEPSNDPFESRNGIFAGEYPDKPVINSKKVRAQWNSKSKDKVNLFALHATAKTNSYIEIYNPMMDRMVIAKIVGNIPEKIHKRNVELIVSPKVAETLGVVDKKFSVTIKYIE